MITYATTDDVEHYTGEPAPEDAVRLLREASAAVRVATRSDRYRTDPSGLPSDDDLREALRDAVCAQVASRGDSLKELASLPGAGVLTSSTIDGATVSIDGSIGAHHRAVLESNRLCSAAYQILRAAGLATAAVQ